MCLSLNIQKARPPSRLVCCVRATIQSLFCRPSCVLALCPNWAMAEPDSWEDVESPSPVPPPHASSSSFRLNANAPSFTFNPSAPSFNPSAAPFIPSLRPPNPPLPETLVAAQSPSPLHLPPPALDVVSAPDTLASQEAAQEPNLPAGVARSDEENNNGTDDAVLTGRHVDAGGKLVENGSTTDQIEEPVKSLSSLNLGEEVQVVQEESFSTDDELSDKHVELKDDRPLEDEFEKKQHLNVVFIGHVDAGKSTIGGQILYLTGMVDERTIQKYEREAKEKNRESWYMAYIMDTNEEERAKGKTVEVGRAQFETVQRRFTILDAPGHKNYVPNMISGASQADVGVLVISARKGEFETGFERGGQTREHAQLAKTLGVSKLFVVVNKMDDPSVTWSKERFDEIEKKIVPFLKSCGYNVKRDVQFLPISGLLGTNLKERLQKSVCTWWDGPCLFEALDTVEPPPRDPNGPFRMPLMDKCKDMGTVVMGKIESGTVTRGDILFVMPNKVHVKVVTIFRDIDEVDMARPGENLRIRLSGVEEEDIVPGFVLSSVRKPIPAVLEFDAQLQIMELLDHKAIFTAGYKAVLHIHSVVEECEIIELLQQIDPKTKKPMKKKVLFVKSGAVVVVRILVNGLICVERFEDFAQLGRFTLRDEGKTVAIGKVMSLPSISTEE